MIKCEKDRKDFPTLQTQEKNILWFGECLWLYQWNQQYSWERISKTIVTPLWILQISHLNKCSTYLRNWYRNKRRSQVWRRLVGRIILWKFLSLIGDERIINLQRTKVYVFWDSVLCLGKIHQNPESNKAWEQRVGWITSSQSYRAFDGIDGEPTKFEWNIFPGFDTLQLCDKVKSLLSRVGETPEKFTRRILFMSMFKRHFLWNKRQWTRMSGKRSTRIFVCQKIW